MRVYSFLSLLLIIALESCTPNITTPPTNAITSSPPTTVQTATVTPKPSSTVTPTFEPFEMRSLPSPNGEYIAYAYDYYGTEPTAIEIKDRSGKLKWKFSDQEKTLSGDPLPTITIYRWSNDGSYLYFCYSWHHDMGDRIYIRESCFDLKDIDIKTGKIQPVLMGGYKDFSISPDDSQIAYIQCEDEACIFHVQNRSTGFEKTNSFIFKSNDYFGIGNIKWAPDGKRLVFETQDKNYLLQTIYLNLSTMQQKVIKEYIPFDAPGWTVFQGWVGNSTLEFAESSDNGVRIIHIDVDNKKVFFVGTPTPSK